MSASTQPPDTPPTNSPNDETAIVAPAPWGADPVVRTTVASANLAACENQVSSTNTISLTAALPLSPVPLPRVPGRDHLANGTSLVNLWAAERPACRGSWFG